VFTYNAKMLNTSKIMLKSATASFFICDTGNSRRSSNRICHLDTRGSRFLDFLDFRFLTTELGLVKEF
jgi:hypothetical protein